MSVVHPNVICLEKTLRCLKPLFTKIRDVNTNRVDFCRFSKRLMTVIWC